MNIVSLSVLSLPLVLMIWAAEAYLLLAICRLAGERITVARDLQFYRGLVQVVDPLPAAICEGLQKRFPTAPDWTAWVVAIGGVFVVRETLVAIIVATSAAA